MELILWVVIARPSALPSGAGCRRAGYWWMRHEFTGRRSLSCVGAIVAEPVPDYLWRSCKGMPMKYPTLPVLILGALLANCAMSAEQRAQRDNERCAARGLQPNTDAFSNCLTALETERQTRSDTRHREMMERSNVPPAATR